MNFLNQAALAANAKEIADEEHLEEKHRVDGGAAIALAIAVANLVANEFKGDELVDFAQEVVLGYEFLEGDHLELKLLGYGFSEHGTVHLLTMQQLDQTLGSASRGLSAVCGPPVEARFLMTLGQERADSPYSLPCSSRWVLTAAALTAVPSLPQEARRVLTSSASRSSSMVQP